MFCINIWLPVAHAVAIVEIIQFPREAALHAVHFYLVLYLIDGFSGSWQIRLGIILLGLDYKEQIHI